MLRLNEMRPASFWWFQMGGWGLFCILSLLFVLPYVRQPSELGYESATALFADQGVMCLGVFLASVALRPVCKSLARKRLSWIGTEVRAAGWSLVVGIATTLCAGQFLLARPEPMELLEACIKMVAVLFLWCNLYFGFKRAEGDAEENEGLTAESEKIDGEHIKRFVVRTGQKILIVPAEEVAWISAAGDYVELHTGTGAHLLRDTMNSLGRRLDPTKFVRIHRSRIINLERVLELRSFENREYSVKLCDGSQHRASRTYARRVQQWLNSGGGQKGAR